MRAGLPVAATFVAVYIGYGLAAEVAAVPDWATLALTLMVFAAPAQFAMVDVAHQGSGATVQMILAGILINLRFFVMSLTLSQLFGRLSRAQLLVSAQFVVASSYLLTFFRSRREPPIDPHLFFRGVAFTTLPGAFLGTVLGLTFGAALSPVLAFGTTLFLPVYFALLLANDVKGRAEWSAAAGSLLLTPIVEYVLPGWGIFVTALAIGAVVTASER